MALNTIRLRAVTTPPLKVRIIQGAVGPQGEQGIQGETGETGPAGETGIVGTPTVGNFAIFASETEIEDGGTPGGAALLDVGTAAGTVAAGDHTHANAVASGAAGFLSGTDKAKLDGIEAGADVTDAANVAAAGAAMLNTENQALTGGATVTSKDLGTQSSGTLTLDMGDRPLQHYTNNGAHTLAPGSVVGASLIDITNGASAGAITTSGWTKVAGDSFTTTNGHKFRCHCSVGNGGSLLVVQALQ
jgi:hypothetical protein